MDNILLLQTATQETLIGSIILIFGFQIWRETHSFWGAFRIISVIFWESEIKSLEQELEKHRQQINAIGKEIAEEGAFIVRLRENERFRKLKKNLRENQEKIQSYDMEAAAKARRQFDEKYGPAKKRESELQAKVAHLIDVTYLQILIDDFLVRAPRGRD